MQHENDTPVFLTLRSFTHGRYLMEVEFGSSLIFLMHTELLPPK